MNHILPVREKKQVLPSVIFGVAFGLIIYQEVLIKLLPAESLQLKIAFCASIIFLIATCFYFLKTVILPRFTLFTKSQKNGIVLLGILTPIILAVAILDGNFLDQSVYFLLPKHTVQIEALPEISQNDEEVILTGIDTQAQGAISYNSLKIQGWERRGNQLVLTNPASNLIEWKGKTGDKLSLRFLSTSDPLNIKIHWDGMEQIYHLFSETPKSLEIKKKFPIPFYSNWLPLAIAAYLSTGFAVFFIAVLLTAFPGFTAIAPPKKNAWIIYALPMYAIWSFYLLVFWPGVLTPDSMSQWEQVVTGQFVHANPVAHTLTIWLITRLWFSPAAVASVQILALGGILGWGIATLQEYGYPRWLAWLTSIALAVSPANSTLSIVLWKDILFSAVVVALTILGFRIAASEGKWLNQRFAWIWLGATLILVSLYRLNGFLVSFINIVAISFIYRNYWKPALKAATLFLTVYFLFTGPVFDILRVRRVDMARDELIVAHLLAGHMEAKTSVILENKEILIPAMAEYPWPYTCYRNSNLFFSPGIDRAYLVEHSSELLGLALKATWQNPQKTLEHFACQADDVYRIPKGYPEALTDFGIVENDYGLTTGSLLPELHKPLLSQLEEYVGWEHDPTIWFVWRMPFWMYLSVFGCIIFCIRNKDWRPLLILLAGLLTVLPYLILTLGQIFRYLYSMYLIGILFSLYFLTGTFANRHNTDKTIPD